MSGILWRSSLRYLRRHLWQVVLSVLGIALGVAVVVSIDLANSSARRAFALSTQAVAGKATHQITGGPTGLDEQLYAELRVGAGVRLSAPLVEGDVSLPEHPGAVLHILGVDPFAEEPFRDYLAGIGAEGELSALLTVPNTALISSDTAASFGVAPGDTLGVRIGTERRELIVAAVVTPTEELDRRGLEGMAVLDISSAQELLALEGRLTSIDLIVPEGPEGEALLGRIEGLLPPGATVDRSAARTEALEQITRSFNLNLTALSLLALIVGMFLIYNTMTFSVVQRRTLIGTLRALGVTRREIFTLVLSEALAIGVVGTLAGLGLGIALGTLLVQLVTQTINDLYFVLSVRELNLDTWSLLKGLLLGLGATLLAALVPAREATGAPPRAVLSRSTIERRALQLVPRAAALGAALLLAGAGLLLLPSRSIWLSFAGLLVVVLGCALLTPGATVMLMTLMRPLMGRAFGMLGRMAARGVVHSLSRTAVAIAALMIAVSVTVGVGVMIGSFRQTVVRWLELSLQSDIYISSPGLVSSRADVVMEPGLIEELRAVPGVAALNTLRVVFVEADVGRTQLLALDLDGYGYEGYAWKEGDAAAIWPAFEERGAAVVSEPYAYRHGLHVGDVVRLTTERGPREIPIAGIFYDYGSDQGVVMLSRTTYDQLWDDPAVASLGVHVAEGYVVDDVIAALRAQAGERELLIRSNRALREESLKVFDRTFAITGVLRLLATGVAFIGVLSALMALQLERSRELGVLRASGLTPRQLWGLVTTQTSLMGLAAGLLSLPVGLLLALVLIHVINKRSFGWTLQLILSPGVFVQALALALIAALLAGIYPAHRMANTPPAVALREE